MAHENGFTLNIASNCSPSSFQKDIHTFVSLKNKSKYSVVLTNNNETLCDVELFIDQEKMGKWRINPKKSITIERPSNFNRKFMFVEENGSDAYDGNVTPGAHRNGLITAKFYPEKEYYNNAHQVDEVIEKSDSFPIFNSAVPQLKGFAFNEPTRKRDNSCYGAQCIRSSLGSRGSVMNESFNMAPIAQSANMSTNSLNDNFSSGATVLNGRSNQNFGKVSAIKDIDTRLITKISLRLVIENVDTVYSIHSRPHFKTDPPRIDRVNPLDSFFPQYDTVSHQTRREPHWGDRGGHWRDIRNTHLND